MIVNGNGLNGLGDFKNIALHYGSADQVGNWLEQRFNDFWYGLPSNIPVPVPAAPQTQKDMTSGNYTPKDSVDEMWRKYRQDSADFFEQIPEDAGNANTLIFLGIAALAVLVLVVRR